MPYKTSTQTPRVRLLLQRGVRAKVDSGFGMTDDEESWDEDADDAEDEHDTDGD